MSGTPTVRVLCDGWIVRDGPRVVDASSTVTVIDTDAGSVVVDTGSVSRRPMLSEALSEAGVDPGDVMHVVNTHLHMDHCGGNDLFSHALFHSHRLEEPPIGTAAFHGDTVLVRGVRLVHTPGHTRGSISVFVDADRRVVICGDAIPTRANYESMAPPAIHFDRALAVRSMEVILGWAETVVPGHDRPFGVMAKK